MDHKLELPVLLHAVSFFGTVLISCQAPRTELLPL